MTTLLVANRGEIAVRVIRTAKDMGIETVAVYPPDDAESLHVRLADRAVELPGKGPAAYLDASELIAAAKRTGARLVHPGYGFLAESAEFARQCSEAGLTFLGPSPEALARAGAKPETRALALELGIRVPAATDVLTDVAPALALLDANPAGIVLKAVAGGGGRGIAIVTSPDELPAALSRCRAEALHGFGDDRVFAEQLLTGARHIEVQGIGGPDGVRVLGDRDCSLQRRRQKVIEIAPAPHLGPGVRADLYDATQRLLEALRYEGLATVEFLVDGSDWVLLEINPRIQVEHTVTEAVTGLDLVACQIELGLGRTLGEIGLPENMAVPESLTALCAIQLRVAAETMSSEGALVPTSGTVSQLGYPTGPGIRVDTWLQPGLTVSVRYDSLLAKIIVSGHDLEGALRRARTALTEFVCVGVDTNVTFLAAVLEAATLGRSDTRWIDDHLHELLRRSSELSAARTETALGGAAAGSGGVGSGPQAGPGQAGPGQAGPATYDALAPGEEIIVAPLSGTLVSLEASSGELGLIESMKMHHPIPAPPHAHARPLVALGDTVAAGQPVFAVVPLDADSSTPDMENHEPHPGIAEVQDRHERVLDAAKPTAVAKIHAKARRTARENLADLVVPGSFVEYGPLAIAAQTARRPLADLIEHTSGDGLIGGIGSIETPAGSVRAVVMSYDYMVLAGTQGARNHAKTDRLLQVASSRELPIVLFAEGGGGRPGDTDVPPGAHLDVQTFAELAGLKGRVPIISIVSGRCFAGNAALAGVADLIIATTDANIGMGGPAMVEGGGLGKWAAEDIGPAALHASTGVVDLLVESDAEAVAAARQVLGYFCTPRPEYVEPAPRLARSAVPSDRLRAFDMRTAISGVVDEGSFLELRRAYAPGAITGFARVAGAPVAIMANDNHHLGGAIDVDAARSFIDLLELAETHRLPVVSFIDTPGFMVGPEAEREPGVRTFGKLFVAGARLSVSLGVVIVRKCYGLGAMAMAAGSLTSSQFTVAWPSGELGPMGLEGGVRLGYAKELAGAATEEAREARFEELLGQAYEQGRAMSAAMVFDVDDVIDPADTRRWIATLR